MIPSLILLLALGAGSLPAMADPQPEPQAVRVEGTTPADFQRLESHGFDIAFRGQGYAELLLRTGQEAELEELGYSWEPLGRDLFPGARAGSREGNMDPEYHTYLEMVAELQNLAATYPSICSFYDIGDTESTEYTWDNFSHQYEVWAVRISDNPNLDEPEPCIVYDGRHHAREPASTEVVLAVARHFCENYATDPDIAELVNTTEIWCVPMINADGHQWVEDIDPWWRKTLYDHNANHHVDDYEGIDPNRNYDWHWDPGTWSDDTYGGPTPFRAPEVATMRDLHNLHRPAINPSYHSYGEVLLYPFGYGVAPEPAVIEVAAAYANQVGYDLTQSTTAYGSSKDWLYGSIGAVSFTVETATEFIPSGPTMEAVVAQNLPAAIALCERLWGASVHGTVTDSIAGIPLAATIHIPEIMEVYGAGELWDMQTEASTGYYCRMRPLAQQTITLQVSAEGYFDRSVQVTTGGSDATVLDIELVPESFDRGLVQGMVTNVTAGGTPVPGAIVTVIGAGASLESRPDGTYSGYVTPGLYQLAIAHESFAPDTSGFVLVEVGEVTTVDFALTDIAGPTINGTTVYASTDDTTGPYVIETTITDLSAVTARTLHYRTTGEPYQALTLESSGLDTYQAEIPGQPYDTMVMYYVEAVDEGDNVATDPPGAPGEVYSFYVAPFNEIFADEIEHGAGDWIHYVVTAGFNDQWHISTQRNHTALGSSSWKCGDTGLVEYTGSLDAALESPAMVLGDNGRMSLWYWIDAEDSSAYPGQAYDGGLIEISVDAGAWTQIFPEEGYTHTVRAGAGGPFPVGTPIFSGTSIDWAQIHFDLSAYPGEEIRVRFRFGSDNNTGGDGWFIDDLLIESMTLPSDIARTDDLESERQPLACSRMQVVPNPGLLGQPTRIVYELNRPAPVELDVLDLSGRVIVSYAQAADQASGVLLWSGTDRLGRALPAGVYFLRLGSDGRALRDERIIRLR